MELIYQNMLFYWGGQVGLVSELLSCLSRLFFLSFFLGGGVNNYKQLWLICIAFCLSVCKLTKNNRSVLVSRVKVTGEGQGRRSKVKVTFKKKNVFHIGFDMLPGGQMSLVWGQGHW